jgi:hypothetical protein
MAKALKKPQPMSSVDRFFANASLDAALARADAEPKPAPPTAEGTAVRTADAGVANDFDAQARESDVEAPLARPAGGIGAGKIEAPSSAAYQGKAADELTTRGQVLSLVQRTGEPVDRQREFQLTRTTDETLEDLVLLYKRSTGAELTRSHVLRAVLKAVAERMPQLKRTATGIGPLRRPSNAKGFEDAREEFEEEIKRAFLQGMHGSR